MRVSITAAVNAVPRSTVPAYPGVALFLPQPGMPVTSYRGCRGSAGPGWLRGNRASEKRKVGGSTPPLTTSLSGLRKRHPAEPRAPSAGCAQRLWSFLPLCGRLPSANPRRAGSGCCNRPPRPGSGHCRPRSPTPRRRPRQTQSGRAWRAAAAAAGKPGWVRPPGCLWLATGSHGWCDMLATVALIWGARLRRQPRRHLEGVVAGGQAMTLARPMPARMSITAARGGRLSAVAVISLFPKSELSRRHALPGCGFG